MRAVAEELGRDAGDRVERVGDGLRLLEDLLLHVVAVGAEIGRAGVRHHRLRCALHWPVVAFGVGVRDPRLAKLQVDHVAFFEIDDLVGDAGQRHGVGSDEVLARTCDGSEAEHQRRALASADDAVRLVAAEHGDGIGAMKARQRSLYRVEQVAVVEVVDEMGDDFGIGLGDEVVALRLQLGAQVVVVLDDAVVHQADPARRGHARGFTRVAPGRRCALSAGAARAVREVRVRVVHERRAVRCPARVGDAGAGFQVLGGDVRGQLGHARRAARAAQPPLLMHGDAARVVAAIFEPAQAFDEHRRDVAGTDRSDDSAHAWVLEVED